MRWQRSGGCPWRGGRRRSTCSASSYSTADQIDALVEEYGRALDAFAAARLDATLSVKMTGLGLSVDETLCAENVRSAGGSRA